MEGLVAAMGGWSNGLLESYAGRRVLITGHTGFKGSWLSWMLARAGAHVAGYALEPGATRPCHPERGDAPICHPERAKRVEGSPSPGTAVAPEPNLYDLCGVDALIDSYIGDIRDFERLKNVFESFEPEFVFHLAAQPIVRDSYDDPRYTFETNVMGTVNILECARLSASVRSVLNVTTDKVYYNADAPHHAFTEDEPLDGYDPYSNSKSCSELVTHSYARSFFDASTAPRVSTARAGNVIGGGDFAPHRIIPDCVRAALAGTSIEIRNPNSTRPFQHVLEPLFAYLLIAMRQVEDARVAGWYNIGPDRADSASAGELASMWCSIWGNGASWVDASAPDTKHEAAYLQLDNSKMKRVFNWMPRWNVERAVEATAQWTRAWMAGDDICACMDAQIADYAQDS